MVIARAEDMGHLKEILKDCDRLLCLERLLDNLRLLH
jgi:hypothetical protein